MRAARRLLVVVAACAAVVAPLPSAASAPANPIQLENAQPGTASWQLPQAVPPSIEGYACRR